MSFAVPSALFLAALAVPIIVFYILKVRLRRLQVSTNLFWNQIYDEKPPRSIWQVLRHLLSLLIQLLILALLVFSVADPYFSWQLLQARRIIAVIDNSASMQATDVEPNRFGAAIESAMTMVEGLRFRDEMAIVLSGPRPEVVLGMSGHIPTLKRALNEIRVSDNPTQLSSAIELGRRLIGDHPRGQVIVFTDGCDEALEATKNGASSDRVATGIAVPDTADQDTLDAGANSNSKTEDASFEYRLFGTRAANIGITQFQVRRSLIDALGYEVLVAVRNSSDEPVKCRLELELAAAPVDILPLELAADETWSRSLEKTSLEGGHLVARITQIARADEESAPPNRSDENRLSATTLNALQADDTAWAILPPRETQRVLIVTEGNLFLQKVFEANPLVRVQTRKDFPERWPADTIIVLHRDIPATLPHGNVFVVDPSGSCDVWDLGDMLENPIVTEQDRESTLMTHVRLDNVLMPEARQVKFKGRPHVLAGALSNDPVYAEVRRDEGKCLVLTLNLDRSDLAFRTAFPIMVTNALGWFAGTSGELRESSATGSVVSWELDEPAGSGQIWTLRSPAGRELTLADAVAYRPRQSLDIATPETEQILATSATNRSVSLGPLDECGVWSLRAETTEETATELPTAEFAVNLADGRESDLRPPAELLDRTKGEPLVAGWLARPVWFYLVAAVCVLTVSEWFLYQRRFIT